MKINCTLLASILALTCVTAGEEKVAIKDVPAEALKALLIQSEGAQLHDLTREIEDGHTAYEATWKMDDQTFEAEVDAKGNILAVETEISEKNLPDAALKRIRKKAKGKIMEISKVTNVVYEVEIEKDGEIVELTIDSQGNILREEKEKD